MYTGGWVDGASLAYIMWLVLHILPSYSLLRIPNIARKEGLPHIISTLFLHSYSPERERGIERGVIDRMCSGGIFRT